MDEIDTFELSYKSIFGRSSDFIKHGNQRTISHSDIFSNIEVLFGHI